MSKIKLVLKKLRDDFYYKSAKKGILKNRKNNKSKTVVFVCQCESVWLKTEPVYLSLKKHGVKCVLLVVEDPLVEKKNSSIFDKYSHDIVKYHPGVIDELKPKILFYSRPYDHYLPKDIRTKKTVHKALLAYIPYYFHQLSIDDGLLEKRFANRISFFFADQKETANQYINLSKKGINQKILNCLEFGYPVFDSLESFKKGFNPKDSAFTKNRNAIKVIWTPRWEFEGTNGVSNFPKYSKYLFDTLINNDKYSFVFRPHPLMFNNFISNGIMSNEEKEALIERLEKSNNSVYDHSGNYLSTFLDCDFLISDSSSIIFEYASLNKPLLYCDSGDNDNCCEYWHKIMEANYFIKDEDELIECIENVTNKNDDKINLRKQLADKVIKTHVGASDRIANYIIEQLG